MLPLAEPFLLEISPPESVFHNFSASEFSRSGHGTETEDTLILVYRPSPSTEVSFREGSL
jgi:hypothetical protein